MILINQQKRGCVEPENLVDLFCAIVYDLLGRVLQASEYAIVQR
jgi:hypothetical protein